MSNGALFGSISSQEYVWGPVYCFEWKTCWISRFAEMRKNYMKTRFSFSSNRFQLLWILISCVHYHIYDINDSIIGTEQWRSTRSTFTPNGWAIASSTHCIHKIRNCMAYWIELRCTSGFHSVAVTLATYLSIISTPDLVRISINTTTS